MKNIVLTGFMASGKTTVAKELAKITGMRMLDTDELVEKREQRTINEIFADAGEAYFRDVESAVIRDTAAERGVIISTGGGAVLRSKNIEELRKNGIVINLEPSVATICSRLNSARATRPLLAGEELDAVIKRFYDRKPYYDNCDCKILVSDAKTPHETAVEILDRMRSLT